MLAYDAIISTPICHIGACFKGDALSRLDILALNTTTTNETEARVQELARELDAYWNDPAYSFGLSIAPQGTPFQMRVWQALTQIPTGKPTTYGALAKQLGTAARAVGQACGANPISIVVPCHRVVAANGLGGFMHATTGAPLDVKTWLLAHERRTD